MHSSKVRSNFVIIIFTCVTIIIVSLLLYKLFSDKPAEKLDAQSVKLELQQGLDTTKELQKNPFLKYLPYRKDGYTIVYSSIKKSIVVIFDAKIGSISSGRKNYENEISAYLRSIGAINNELSIKWDIEKETNQ